MFSIRPSFVQLVSACALVLASGCGADAHDVGDVADAIEDVHDVSDGSSALSSGRRAPKPDYTEDELLALAHSPEIVALNHPFEPGPMPSQSVYVTASDGTRLAVSLYFPAGFEQKKTKAPVVYIEGWYPRATVESGGEAVNLYREAGFVVAIGDPRGFGSSFGAQPGFLLERERLDQREVVGWLTSQPWSNGKVAAVGFSVSATHAEAMAASGIPGLGAAIIRESDFDNYTSNLFPGGVPNIATRDFVTFLMSWVRADFCPIAECGFLPVDGDTDLSLLTAAVAEHRANPAPEAIAPLVYRDDRLGTGTVEEMSAVGHIAELQKTAIPARVSASWVDGATAEGALRRFTELPNVPMEVTITSNTHSGGLNGDPFVREAFQVATPGAAEQFGADVAFVKRVLAGERIGRSVSYYVLGAGTWETTNVWPPRGVRSETLHFSRTGLTDEPSRGRGERRYQVDPTSSAGSFNRWAAQTGAAVYYGDRRFAPGARLSFDAASMTRDTELLGAPELCLVMRSDQTDGIVIAYLEDVAPDGRVTYLTEGELRLLHRKTKTGGCNAAAGTERTFARADGAPVKPGEAMELEIPLLPTAALIRKGHHLRLSLAGADAGPTLPADYPQSSSETFPTLTETPATWSVAFGGKGGSRLSLPVKSWSRH